MPLSDDDKKEVSALLRGELGLEEGQKLTDVLKAAANGEINRYEKSKAKEIEKLTAELKALSESVTSIKDKPAPEPAPNDDPSDLSKLPKSVRDRIEAMEKSNKDLAKTVEAERAQRVEQEAKAAEQAKKQADRDLRDYVRGIATGKTVGIEAEAVDLVIGHIHGDRIARGEESLIRRSESGVYEMLVGTNKYNGEPEYKPVEEGMKEWVKTPLGKRFLPPVPGNGTPQVPNRQPTHTGIPADFTGMTPAQIREATKSVTSVG